MGRIEDCHPPAGGSTALASLRTNKLAASVVANLKMQAQQAAEEPSAALNDSDNDSSEAREGHGYDDGAYWDKRYGDWASDPYDWLVEFKDMEIFIGKLFNPADEILCPGCGNAPFHPDMYTAGWERQICVDTSQVVIDQSIERMSSSHPDMEFYVKDCTALDDADGKYSSILDKSLIDTLRCEAGSYDICEKFVGEMHRVLKPGGFMITVSLNSYTKADIEQYYIRDKWNWTVAYGDVRNPSYEKPKDNTEFYTVIVCSQKENDHTLQPLVDELIALSEARYEFTANGKLVLKA